MRRAAGTVSLAAALAIVGCAHAPADDPADPLEPVNRAMFSFNQTADKYVLRPVAKGYDWVLPDFAQTGVGNFFNNLFAPTSIVNDLLQLKFKEFAIDLGSFVVNSTIGLAGLVDVTGTEGLADHTEDFGQTLGHWGVGEGWYLVLPLWGPTDNRDLLGGLGDHFTNPIPYIDNTGVEWGLRALNVVDTRAQYLSADRVLDQQLDRYVFVRTVYLQNRQNRVYDGKPPKEDYDFDE